MDNQQRPKQYFPDPEHQTQYYEPEAYYEPQSYYELEPQRSNGLAIGLGIALAIALCAGTVLFFLWRSAAAEADKPPVTSTVTETAVSTETVTETTTKRPKLLPDRGRGVSGETVAPTEPAVEVPTELRGLFDDIVSGAESALQGQ
ncbi:hypothetical protein [Corynebacterium pseudogenitalium]|uniref:Uncharacterized protein n=1 Tax=Corynebacterium pseudogenitalium TaxID=38303 RepID=A0ABD4TTZ6_9CORY|nr:hypothetical protein [Corynebacterium pseudogenitalium]MCQ4614765.1 hypothetical protein [Corynebacterium pseudogenitalium]